MKRKLLVVDDSPDLLDALYLYLEGEGYQVLKAKNGQEALHLAALERPDMIVLDVNMPRMDGFEVARRLRTHRLTATIPIIFLTVRSTLKDRMTGLSYGAVDYISKPFSMEELKRRIESGFRKIEEIKKKLRKKRRM